MSSKDSLRKEIAARLSRFSPEEEKCYSLSLCRSIRISPEYQGADALFAYYPFRRETNVLPLLDEALKGDIPVFLPLITGKEMTFRRVFSLEKTELVPNKWGIFEPESRLPAGRGEDFSRPLMLLPGVAFTMDGRRLGRGGGFYDRYLEKGRGNLILAGTAYPCQIVDDLPAEPHDVLMDKVFY